jgi:hypothetical protein
MTDDGLMGPRSDQPKRWTFTAEYKLAMVAEYDAATKPAPRMNPGPEQGRSAGGQADQQTAPVTSAGRRPAGPTAPTPRDQTTLPT